MSYSTCVRGGGLCTGCMRCQDVDQIPEEFYCDDCGSEIDSAQGVFEVDGEILCMKCLCERYAKQE